MATKEELFAAVRTLKTHCRETECNACVLEPLCHQVEIEVVACKEPYLMVRYFNDCGLANWRIGMKIKYCPVCGRRLTDG